MVLLPLVLGLLWFGLPPIDVLAQDFSDSGSEISNEVGAALFGQPDLPYNPIFYLLGLVLFLILATTDWIDGWYARAHNQVTEFGKFWDPVADKLLVLVGYSVLCYQWRIYFWWFMIPLVVMLIREIAVTVLRLKVMDGGGAVIAANLLGKIKTVVQLVSIPIYLLGPLLYFVPNLFQTLAQPLLGLIGLSSIGSASLEPPPLGPTIFLSVLAFLPLISAAIISTISGLQIIKASLKL
jgi:CDP-diacylglycerol--glycerol-3-phosphate 3-phosphatidyltransferase